jgi:hypothetical protein
MHTESRTFWMAKDAGYEAEYEDASAVSDARGVVAIADGVSSAIFSREWADILTRAVADDPPRTDHSDFGAWLARCRLEWRARIDFGSLNYFQREKLRQCGGAYSTLLWASWQPAGDSGLGWRATATGDSGMFHVRGGEVLKAFPITASAQLAADPMTICSIDRGHDGQLDFRAADGEARPGDRLVFCTDALLGWALAGMEAGSPPDWDEFWEYDEARWRERITRLRDEGQIRVDDTTLIVVRVL